jgi:hypothetical protein
MTPFRGRARPLPPSGEPGRRRWVASPRSPKPTSRIATPKRMLTARPVAGPGSEEDHLRAPGFGRFGDLATVVLMSSGRLPGCSGSGGADAGGGGGAITYQIGGRDSGLSQNTTCRTCGGATLKLLDVTTAALVGQTTLSSPSAASTWISWVGAPAAAYPVQVLTEGVASVLGAYSREEVHPDGTASARNAVLPFGFMWGSGAVPSGEAGGGPCRRPRPAVTRPTASSNAIDLRQMGPKRTFRRPRLMPLRRRQGVPPPGPWR